MYRPQKRLSWLNQPSASSFLLFSKLHCFSTMNCFSIPPMWLEMSPFHNHYLRQQWPPYSQAKRGPFSSFTWKSHPPWTQVSIPFFQTSSTTHFPVWCSGFSNLSSVLPVSWQYPWNSVHLLSSIMQFFSAYFTYQHLSLYVTPQQGVRSNKEGACFLDNSPIRVCLLSPLRGCFLVRTPLH